MKCMSLKELDLMKVEQNKVCSWISENYEKVQQETLHMIIYFIKRKHNGQSVGIHILRVECAETGVNLKSLYKWREL